MIEKEITGESLAREDVISDYRDSLDDSEEFDKLIAEQDRIIDDLKDYKPPPKIPLPDGYDKWDDGTFTISNEYDWQDEDLYKMADPSKLEDDVVEEGLKDVLGDILEGSIFMGKDKKQFKKNLNTPDKANELDANHFKDPETWYNATQGVERETLAGGGLSDPYDELPEWNQENIYMAWNAKKDGEVVDRSDWYPDEDYYKGESRATEGHGWDKWVVMPWELRSQFGLDPNERIMHDRKAQKCLTCGAIVKVDDMESHADTHSNESATEGGRGSGKIDHRPWMLGTELSDVCEICMISTEWNGTVCTMCGTDSKTL